MAFTSIIDYLGFMVVLILAGAVVLAWTSGRAFLAMLGNDRAALRSILKSSAIPVGIIGVVSAAVGLFIETTWPFLASDGLALYNILFGDVFMLFAMVMVVYAIVAYWGLKLEYAGLFGFIAGITTPAGTAIGSTPRSSSPEELGLDEGPLGDLASLPCVRGRWILLSTGLTLVVDYYLEHPGPTWARISWSFRPTNQPAREAGE